MKPNARFTLRSLLIVVTLICTWLGWRYTNQRVRQRDVCRQLVAAALMSEHLSSAIDDGGSTASVMASFSFDVGGPYIANFIKPDGTIKGGEGIDRFEEELIGKLPTTVPDNGADIFFEVQRFGSYRFYQPIWAGTKCSACHSPGSLVAIVRIEVQQ